MPTTLNRSAFEKLVEENLFWLLGQPRSLERDHIESILRHVVAMYYPVERRIAALEAENAALRADKERLDWLERSKEISSEEASEIVNGRRYLGKYYPTMREAIDAARKAAPDAQCQHQWVSKRNGKVTTGFLCRKCFTPMEAAE